MAIFCIMSKVVGGPGSGVYSLFVATRDRRFVIHLPKLNSDRAACGKRPNSVNRRTMRVANVTIVDPGSFADTATERRCVKCSEVGQ